MTYIHRTYNKLKSTWIYRSHTDAVHTFVREMYPTLTAKSILGPLFDNDDFIDKEEQKELIYLVTFNKDCPENQIHLKVQKSTKEVSEIEKLY